MSTATLTRPSTELSSEIPEPALPTTPPPPAVAVELPPLLPLHRRLGKYRRTMHHNRLVAIVVAVNLAVLVDGIAGAGWWSGPTTELGAMSTMVLANLALATLIRQHYVINLLFWLATRAPTRWPLKVRWTLGKIYHFGGLHVGGTISATVWFTILCASMAADQLSGKATFSVPSWAVTVAIVALLTTMVVFATPTLRAKHHDVFERTHRFGGWTALVLFWAHSLLFVAEQHPGGSTVSVFVRTPQFWVLVAVVLSVALPWLRLRRVPVDIATPSSHVAIVRFDYGVTPFAGSSTTVSRNPLVEWHSFANVPAPDEHGFRLTISRSGDWTGALIDDKPSHVWVKGIPTAGVGNIDQLFTRVVWVATGSGIGPCLPHLLAANVPSRLVWSTRHPRGTYGDQLVDELLAVQPDAVIWDTDGYGKPDLLGLAYRAYREFDAEAVICISNKKTTWQIVEGLETRDPRLRGDLGLVMASYETLDVEYCDGIMTVSVSRPEALNALSRGVLTELERLLTSPSDTVEDDVRGMILTGAGARAFIAGADIREMAAMTPDEGERFSRLGQRVTELLESLPVPVVACVNGYALGGGCEMAMACDYVLATDNARFGQPEVSLGLIPGFGGCVRLARYVGPGRAKEMIYSGRQVSADEARRIGLVNDVFRSKEEMLAAATQSLRAVAANSPVAVSICKATINAGLGRPTAEALDIEAAAFRLAFTTEDMREGTKAFIDKRQVLFPGR